ncbi:hypothetical protein V8C37DRAFT_216458 [Trichoderma ceciliae]
MEPNNYGPHSPTRSFHPDISLHGPSPLDWTSHDHNLPPVSSSPWAPTHASVPSPYHYQRPYSMGFDSQPMGLTGGLPLPNPTTRVYPLPYPHPGPPMHARPWTSNFPPVPPPVPPNHASMLHVPNRHQFGLPPSAARSAYPLQPPENESGMGLRGTTLEADTLSPRSIYIQPPATPLSPYTTPAPHPTNPIPQQMSPVPQGRRPSYHTLPGTSSRVTRATISSPPFGSLPHHHDLSGLPPHRRSAHSRARRSLSTRLAVPDLGRDTEEDFSHDTSDYRPGPVDYRASQGPADTADDTNARQIQTPRGDVSDKKTASKVALWLLEYIKIEELPEKERSCVICYNDFGVETPEGVHEVPLRLPKCKHVFGDQCIRRWLEESDSCPYCRDKLQLETRHHFDGSANQAFMTMMRVRSQLSPGTPEEMYMRLMSNLVPDEDYAESGDVHMPERRSYRISGDLDSSAPDGESTASASSSTSASPIRIPPRDASRYSQWPPRVAQQRGAHSPLGQEREVSRHRRQRFSRNNLSMGMGQTGADGDSSTLHPVPLQTLRPDAPTQSTATIPSASTGDNERIQSLANVQRPAVDSSVAQATQNRNRPW